MLLRLRAAYVMLLVNRTWVAALLVQWNQGCPGGYDGEGKLTGGKSQRGQAAW